MIFSRRTRSTASASIEALIVPVFVFSLAAGGCKKTSDPNAPIEPGIYEVQEGDDLSSLVLRAYGDRELWYALLNANPEVQKRPRFELVAGEELTIPERSKLDMSLPKSIFPKELPAEYIIMPGDSLHFIAQGCYGDRGKWIVIYEANRSNLSERVKQDTRQLFAGEVLTIPSLD